MKLFSTYLTEATASDYIRVDKTGDNYEYADGFGDYVQDFGSLDTYQQQIIIKNAGDFAITGILQSKPKLTPKIKAYILEYVMSRMGSHAILAIIPKLKTAGIITEESMVKYCTKLMSKHNSIFDNWPIFNNLVGLCNELGISPEIVEKILAYNPIFLAWGHFNSEEELSKLVTSLTTKQISAALSCEQVIVKFPEEYNKLMHILLKDNSVLMNKWKRYAENIRSMA
jgi:hypothetical protein